MENRQHEKLVEKVQEMAIRVALIDDAVEDLCKSFTNLEVKSLRDKQKNITMIVCILTCIAMITAGVLQGVLTGE